MRTLIAILTFFSTSYLIRFICYSYIVNMAKINKPFKLCLKQSSSPPEKVSCIYFSTILFFMLTPIIYDFLPIGAILFFHKRNFTVKNNELEN